MSELQNYYASIVHNLHHLCREVTTCEQCRGHGDGPPTGEEKPCTQCDEETRRECYRCGTTGFEVIYSQCKPCEGKGYIIGGDCGGWVLTDLDTVHKCPHHYNNQPEPEL
jgi:hypothetical protein